MTHHTSAFSISLESVVNSFRLGMEGQANDELTNLIDILGKLLGKADEGLVLQISPLLKEAFGAIERKDFLWAADILENEISPLLMPLTIRTETSTIENSIADKKNVANLNKGNEVTPQFSPKGKELIAMYAEMAEDGYERTDSSIVEIAFSDFELRSYKELVLNILQQENISTILDYGCGGSNWCENGFDETSGKSAKEYFSLKDTYQYEPARKIDERQTVDCVISFDVLEHVFISDVPAVLHDMFSYANKLLFLNVACYPAAAKLPNNENAHITVREPSWWKGVLDSISIHYPDTKVYLMCSTAWQESGAFPIWSAKMWQQDDSFVINY